MNTTRAIRIHDLGGPEVLRWEEIPVPDPGPGEVLVRQEAIGLNYGDIYRRSGIRATPSLPAVIGVEAAGVVEAVGPSPHFSRACWHGAFGWLRGFQAGMAVPAER